MTLEADYRAAAKMMPGTLGGASNVATPVSRPRRLPPPPRRVCPKIIATFVDGSISVDLDGTQAIVTIFDTPLHFYHYTFPALTVVSGPIDGPLDTGGSPAPVLIGSDGGVMFFLDAHAGIIGDPGVGNYLHRVTAAGVVTDLYYDDLTGPVVPNFGSLRPADGWPLLAFAPTGGADEEIREYHPVTGADNTIATFDLGARTLVSAPTVTPDGALWFVSFDSGTSLYHLNRWQGSLDTWSTGLANPTIYRVNADSSLIIVDTTPQILRFDGAAFSTSPWSCPLDNWLYVFGGGRTRDGQSFIQDFITGAIWDMGT